MDIIGELKYLIGNKRIILYGYGTMGATAHLTLHRLGYKVAMIIDQDESKHSLIIGNATICSPYDLIYEEQDSVIIFITSDGGRNEIAEVLVSMGFQKNVHFSMFFLEGRCAPFPYFEPHVGWSRGNRQIVSRSKSKAEHNVLTLGGSTTDYSLNGFRSWPDYLGENLDNKYGEGYYNIYMGGAASYCSSQELFELIVSGICIENIDVVVSYSGYNDAAGLNQYEYSDSAAIKTFSELVSIANEHDLNTNLQMYFGNEIKNHADLWLKNMRIMRGVCNQFNIKFIAILQPNYLITEMCDKIEQEIFDNSPYKQIIANVKFFYEKMRENIRNYDWIYDFSHIFDDYTEVYLDSCHIYEQGNKIIANRICKLIDEEEEA